MRKRKTLLIGAALACLPHATVFAQTHDDVIVMRRAIAPPKKAAPTPPPASTEPDVNGNSWLAGEWSWMEGAPTCSDTATRIRSVACLSSSGVTLPDSTCLNTRPPTTENIGRYENCAYTWSAGGWSDWFPACTEDATRSRDVTCTRTGDGVSPGSVSDDFCAGQEKPSASESGPNTAQCDFYWRVGEFGPWEGSCESNSTRSRSVICANAEGDQGDESECLGAKPESVQTAPAPNQCSYGWEVGPWEGYSATCSSQAVRNRKVQCVAVGGDLVGAPQPDDKCALVGEKPPVSEISENFSGCTFSWSSTPVGEWSSSCSSTATRDVSISCERSDGTSVSDSFCNQQNKPSNVQTGNYAGCSTDWVVGDWGTYDSDCSIQAQRERTVQCYATGPDFSPRLMDDNRCLSSSRPASFERMSITSGCTMKWYAGQWGAWSSLCSADAVRERSVFCSKSDATVLPDEDCAALGEKPVASETGNFSKCENKWDIGSWSEWTAQCSASASRSRAVVCKNDSGAIIADSSCIEDKPAVSETGNFAGCAKEWAVGDWGEWSSTCSKNASRTRGIQCVREDGVVLENKDCDGEAPAREQKDEVTSGCSYEWKTGSWSSPNSCSSSVILSRSVSCFRSDGSIVEDSFCNSAGAKPNTTMQGEEYSGCTYKWYQSGLVWSASCSATATQSQTVYCQRSNGDAVDDALCAGQGAKPSTAGTQTGNFLGCSYEWVIGEWGFNDVPGAWSSECSASARQTRTVSCRRSDDVMVDDKSCSGNKPVTSQTAYRDSGCTNKWVPDVALAYQATACINGEITIWETYMCVNSNGQQIAPSNGSYCSKIGIGPLSTTADNVIPTRASCSLSASSFGALSSTGSSSVSATSLKIVTGTFPISGTSSIATASVQDAAMSACLAAAKSRPDLSTPICSVVQSWSDAANIYYDWTLRTDNNKLVAQGAGSTCDLYNESFNPGPGFTDLRRQTCGTVRMGTINYSSIALSGASFVNPLTCSKRINMYKSTGWYSVPVPEASCQ